MPINSLILGMANDLEKDDLLSLEKKNKKYLIDSNSKIQMALKLFEPVNCTKKLIVNENTNDIGGLWYIENYLTKEELDMIKNKLETEINLEPIYNSSSRRVAHYGYYYSYDRSGLKMAPSIPDYLANLVSVGKINHALKMQLVENEFEQLIINEYKTGQKIAYHTDHTKLFGPIVACITVGQAVPIKFKYGDIIKTINVDEGSLYIMTNDARYKWQHSLNNTTNNTRYSLTYRTINK